jgi:hypothetical protein
MTVTDFLLTFKVQTTSPQKAAALRDRCAGWLDEDDQVAVVNAAMAQETRNFEVLGVDITSKKPFKERTEARDEEQAIKNVVDSDKSKVVNEVRPA